MKKRLIAIVLAITLLVTMSGVALAGNGNNAPTGPHYNLNIIGVSKDKNVNMDQGSGNTIFVPLDRKVKILLCDSSDEAGDCYGVGYQVLDKNGTDGTASFALPNPDPTCGETGCTAEYSVWARALGKPGGKSFTTTCATEIEGEIYVCSVISMPLKRGHGKQSFTDVSKFLLYIYLDTDDDGTPDEIVPLFDPEYEDFLWEYDNMGLKNAQLRFYPIGTEVPPPGQTPMLRSISPSSHCAAAGTLDDVLITGGNVDFQSTTQAPTSVDVSKQSKIRVSDLNVTGATTLTVDLDLTNANVGVWDVYVTLADGTAMRIQFEVLEVCP